MLCPWSAVDAVGDFDEGYWMYAEDLDWCRRFREAGYTIRFAGGATAIHVKGASSGAFRSSKANWWFHYAMLRYARQRYRGLRYLPLHLILGLALGTRFAINEARREMAARLGHGRETRSGSGQLP